MTPLNPSSWCGIKGKTRCIKSERKRKMSMRIENGKVAKEKEQTKKKIIIFCHGDFFYTYANVSINISTEI